MFHSNPVPEGLSSVSVSLSCLSAAWLLSSIITAPLPPLPCFPLCSPWRLCRCFTSLLFALFKGMLQPVMNTKPSLDRSSDLVKNEEAQEIPPMRSYLCLTMFTCFCPAWPINIVALVFSVLVSNKLFWTFIDNSIKISSLLWTRLLLMCAKINAFLSDGMYRHFYILHSNLVCFKLMNTSLCVWKKRQSWSIT